MDDDDYRPDGVAHVPVEVVTWKDLHIPYVLHFYAEVRTLVFLAGFATSPKATFSIFCDSTEKLTPASGELRFAALHSDCNSL
jgi:hypothetical protein